MSKASFIPSLRSFGIFPLFLGFLLSTSGGSYFFCYLISLAKAWRNTFDTSLDWADNNEKWNSQTLRLDDEPLKERSASL